METCKQLKNKTMVFKNIYTNVHKGTLIVTNTKSTRRKEWGEKMYEQAILNQLIEDHKYTKGAKLRIVHDII